MIIRTSDIAILAGIFRFVRRRVIFTIINSIANLTIGYASMIFASEFTSTAIFVIAIEFISSVTTIVFVVTSPGVENTPSVSTSKKQKEVLMLAY